MVASGQSAWVKFFQGKGDVETILKKDTPIFDASNPAKKLPGELSGGTAVTYIGVTAYEPKALVQYKKGSMYQLVRVPFDNIAKPGIKAASSPSLKPASFGLLEKVYSLTDYKKVILSSIDTRKDLSPSMKVYLNALFDYYAGGRTKTDDVSRIYSRVKNDLSAGDISKDFGEVLGPVAMYTKNLLKDKGIDLSSSMQVYNPLRSADPLMDYQIIDGRRKITVSSRAGTVNNLMLPSDIIELLKHHKDIQRIKQTKEYRVLDALSKNTILLGPIRAVSIIYPELIKPEAARKVDVKSFDMAGFAAFINTNDYLRTKKMVTVNEIMYECEKLLQKETKDGMLNMNKLFSKAIEKQIVYAKFQLDASGVGEWLVTAADDIAGPQSQTRVYLTTKNGYTRSSDRMGIKV